VVFRRAERGKVIFLVEERRTPSGPASAASRTERPPADRARLSIHHHHPFIRCGRYHSSGRGSAVAGRSAMPVSRLLVEGKLDAELLRPILAGSPEIAIG